MRQAIIWNNADPIHWRIYTALGDELNSNLAKFQLLIVYVIVVQYFWIALENNWTSEMDVTNEWYFARFDTE